MKRLDALHLFFFSAVLLAFSCNHATEPPVSAEEPASHGILPLKVGYYWHYKEYHFEQDSTVGLPVGETRYRIRRVSFHATGNGYCSSLPLGVLAPLTNTESDLEWLRTNNANGLYLMGGMSLTDTLLTRHLDRKYPLAKGDSWFRPHLVYDLLEETFVCRDSILYTCVATEVLFATPLGTFSCVVYRYIEDLSEEDVLTDWEHYEYWAYDMGKVGDIKYIYDQRTGDRSLSTKTVLVETNVPLPHQAGSK